LFKFIVPSEKDNIARVELAFLIVWVLLSKQKIKTTKFTSISVDVQVKDSQEIVDKYLEVSTIRVLFHCKYG
jgi:hypothetical protein